jgi:glycosyltransferase involved in cell wall biosynthesis
VTLISSTIDTDVYVPRQPTARSPKTTIGWSGSHSTAPYLHQLDAVMRPLSQRFPLKLLVIGDAGFAVEGVEVDARPWALERETSDLGEIDIGVYPLPDEEWVLGKSGLKALQYMGMGIPVVASRIGAACEFIKDGENGFLASTPEEWIEKISRLVQDPALRRRVGAEGRRVVEDRYSIRANSAIYLDVLTSVLPKRSEGAGVAPDSVGVPRVS